MKKFLFAIMLGSGVLSHSQIIEKSGEVKTYLLEKLETMPLEGTNVFQNHSSQTFQTFNSAIETIANHHFSDASELLADVGYQLIKYTDTETERIYYILEENTQNMSYQGTYVYCASCTRTKVVLQAPHSLKDADTGSEAIEIFYSLQNKWLMFNSSHRCNSTTASTCDGTTSVCGGGSQPYPISDMTHNEGTLLQSFTMALDEYYESNELPLFIVQLHGFGKDSRPDDFPHVVASHGTRKLPPEERTESQQIHDKIEALCECEVGQYHIDTEIDQLGGTNNTQGRYLNESDDPCNSSATVNSGKFYHIEQSSFIRENYDWILQALVAISAPLGSEPTLGLESYDPVKIYPNPVQDKLKLTFNDGTQSNYHVELINTIGKTVLSQSIKLIEKNHQLDLSELTPGIYFLKINNGSKPNLTRTIIKK